LATIIAHLFLKTINMPDQATYNVNKNFFRSMHSEEGKISIKRVLSSVLTILFVWVVYFVITKQYTVPVETAEKLHKDDYKIMFLIAGFVSLLLGVATIKDIISIVSMWFGKKQDTPPPAAQDTPPTT